MARKRSSESSKDDVIKNSSESSGDDVKDGERDRYRHRSSSSKKSSKSDRPSRSDGRHYRRDKSDDSDLEERNRAKRDDNTRNGEEDRDKDEGRKSKHREIKEESESSEEEGQIKGTVREEEEEEGERSRMHYDQRRGKKEGEDGLGVRESCGRYDEDGKRAEKDRYRSRERTYEHENGDGWRGAEEDRRRIKDRRVRHESEEEYDRVRKSERDRDRDRERNRDKNRDRRHRAERDGDNERDRREKDVSKRQEESRKKEDGHGRMVDSARTQREVKIPEGNLNGDASNLGKSGGVYIPPFKLARMMKEVQDKSSAEYQRLTWDALRKSINGLVNKVNATNIKNIIPELFAENLVRGRGLFCRSCMKSQMASPGFTDVFAALVAVVNTKFPEVGELLLRRIVLQLKRAYKRNDKPQLLAAVKFIAHLVNQQVAHEIIALELLTVLLEKPTDDSVEVAVGFVTECGSILQDLSPKGLHGIFERFRGILHEGEIDKRVQFLIEGLFAIRKAKFQGHPAVRPELDLVEQEDQLTHEVSLDEDIDQEISLDIFKPNPNFLENEKRYEELKKTILGEESEDEEGSDAESDEDDEDNESDEEEEESMEIKDETETNLVNLRRTIYLTIMSSVDFEEAGHKLLKIKLEPGQEMELCIMLLECCSQERTYLRYYEDTTSSSRIFIKILFQELSEHLGIRLLNERLNDATMQDSYESIFPKDNPKNTRFCINFFTSIGLGGLTENLREYLKNMPRLIMQQQKQVSDSESGEESGSSVSSDSVTASSESDSDSASSDESDRRRRKRRRK
ncbi:uncharacterized protein LOC133300253 isoform X2 [Gastrolobium bilobum]|uniref:uncharacterized protein LOC133300253 isoform X2 n=1 Tax=Gastrolobium bilobum TaxID=150636 RepID=UPI002AB2D953|nr:uncharacterized protein LOC133300253 isoform X2 [Gastrolobium bilobum]